MGLKEKGRCWVVWKGVTCFLRQAQFTSGTLTRRYLRKSDTLIVALAPGLVVRFELAIAGIFDRLLIIVVGRDPIRDAETLIAAEHMGCVEEAISDAYLDRGVLVVDKPHKLHRSVEENDAEGHKCDAWAAVCFVGALAFR